MINKWIKQRREKKIKDKIGRFADRMMPLGWQCVMSFVNYNFIYGKPWNFLSNMQTHPQPQPHHSVYSTQRISEFRIRRLSKCRYAKCHSHTLCHTITQRVSSWRCIYCGSSVLKRMVEMAAKSLPLLPEWNCVPCTHTHCSYTDILQLVHSRQKNSTQKRSQRESQIYVESPTHTHSRESAVGKLRV